MGTPTVDDEVIDLVAEILPAGDYVPLLLEITPRLVYPMSKGDYVAEEQVETWGTSVFWGLPENQRTPY